MVVGQTPPPFGGQAIMIQNMLNASYDKIKLVHVRMSFSADMDDIGKFQWKKLWKLFTLIVNTYWMRITTGAKILYYPPAGPDRVPILRDIIFLNAVRWLFRKVVFHFHAAGVSEVRSEFDGMLGKLYSRAYDRPDVTIRLSEYNPEDGKGLKAKKDVVILNGLADIGGPYYNDGLPTGNDRPHILFVGVLQKSKGVEVLIEAARILHEQGHDFQVELMGRFESRPYQGHIQALVEKYGLENKVKFLGVQTGEEKFASFARCDIFCFPTFFESETFGLVALEAMQFGKPVVATFWRGVPTVVAHEETGFLVQPHDPEATAEKLAQLMSDPELRRHMGVAGRNRYLSLFTDKEHHTNMEALLASLG